MAAPWDGKLSTYLGAGAIGSRPASPNIAPGMTGFWVNTADNTVSYYVNGTGWTNTAGGGSGGGSAVFGHSMQGYATDLFSQGYAFGCPVVVPDGVTLKGTGFFAGSAAAGASWRVGLYSDSSGAVNAKLAESSVVSGIAAGMNKANFTTPYTNSAGAPVILWPVVATSGADFSVSKTTINIIKYWNNSGTTLPSTAPAQTGATNGWSAFTYS